MAFFMLPWYKNVDVIVFGWNSVDSVTIENTLQYQLKVHWGKMGWEKLAGNWREPIQPLNLGYVDVLEKCDRK